MPRKSQNPPAERKSQMQVLDVIEFYHAMEHIGAQIWVDGRWGVDALLGKQTRAHKDLDIVIQQKDLATLRQWLELRGTKK